jgi:hypothetical protein
MSEKKRNVRRAHQAGVPVIRIVRDPKPRLIAEVLFPDGRVSTDWDDFLRARGLGEDAVPADDDPVGVETVTAA